MLKITKNGFSSILLDNDQFYINFVLDALKHSDPEANIRIDKYPDEIKVAVTPSDSIHRQHIIQNLLDAHRLFEIKIIFSKSLAISKIVSFLVEWK